MTRLPDFKDDLLTAGEKWYRPHASTKRVLRRLAPALAIAAALLLSVLLVDSRWTPEREAEPAQTHAGTRGPQALEVFRTAARPVDRVPREDVSARQRRLSIEDSRLLGTFQQSRVYAAPGPPGSEYVCLMSDSYLYGGCPSMQTIKSGAAVGLVLCSPYMDPDVNTVYGLVPDGSRAAQITNQDGTTRSAAIDRNFLHAAWRKQSKVAQSVAWTMPDRRKATVRVPRGATESTCSRAFPPEEASAYARNNLSVLSNRR